MVRVIAKWLIGLLLFLSLGLSASGQNVQAASYDNNTLADYGIPDDVVQVLLDHSTYADGTTPSAKGQTPQTFTLADIQQLTVVSLANYQAAAGGGYTSTPNDTVADWVAGLQSGNGYNTAANAYQQNVASAVVGDNGSLARKTIDFDGQQSTAPFNFLMQIIASADHAETVDLTGITSKVTDTGLVEQLLSMLQTNRLTSLTTLILAHNNLASTSSWLMPSTLFNVSALQNVTTLDLSDNNMAFSSASFNQGSFLLMKKLTTLNLAGNDVTYVQGWLANAIATIAANKGTSDLSGSHLNAQDWNTMNTMMTVLNSNSGNIRLSDASINNLIQAIPTTYAVPEWQLKAAVVDKYRTQLTPQSAKLLLDHNPNVSADSALVEQLQAVVKGEPSQPAGENALQVTGSLNFGTLDLPLTSDSYPAKDGLTMNATITAGSVLTVAATPWQASDGKSQFIGTLTLPEAKGLWQQTTLQDSPQVLYTNDTASAVTAKNISLSGVTLAVPSDQQANIQPQQYGSSLIWTLSNPASANQQ